MSRITLIDGRKLAALEYGPALAASLGNSLGFLELKDNRRFTPRKLIFQP